MARVGWLNEGPPYSRPSAQQLDAFREGLQNLGYVEGQNLLIESRWAEGQPDRLPELATELASLPVDVLVTGSNYAAQAAKQATSIIPIVMAVSGDPVGTGLVASLARPGGNVTGLSLFLPDFASKRLELLKETLPGMTRVGVLRDANATPGWFRVTQAAAEVLGVEVVSMETRGPDDIHAALEKAAQARVDALFPLEHSLIGSYTPRVVEFAITNRLPGMYTSRAFVQLGGLMSYGASVPANFRRAAYYVDRILKGTKPTDLPVEQPMRFDFVVNMKTAQALGITFPNEIMLQVTDVIQ